MMTNDNGMNTVKLQSSDRLETSKLQEKGRFETGRLNVIARKFNLEP